MTLPTSDSFTSRLGFAIRAGSHAADYQDFIDMMNKLDPTSGFVLCTEATKPTPMYNGHYIKCTDSGKHYYYAGGVMTNGVFTASGSWVEDLYAYTYTLSGSQGNVIAGATRSTPYVLGATGGVSGGTKINVASATSTDMGLTVAFSLASTKVCEIDIDGWLACVSGVSCNTYAQSNIWGNGMALASGPGAMLFELFDNGVSIGVAQVINAISGGGTSGEIRIDYPIGGKKTVSLASGSHSITVKATNSGAIQGSGSNIFVYVDPTITVTVSA